MVDATPAAALEVGQAQFLLEFLVVALNAPAAFRRRHQGRQGGGLGQRRQPVLRWLGLARRPLDQQPLLGAGLWSPRVPMRGVEADGGEARGQRPPAALAPGHPPPRRRRDGVRARLDRDRLVGRRPTHPSGRPARPPPPLGGQRASAGGPDGGRSLNPDGIAEAQGAHPGAEGGVVAIGHVGQHHPGRDALRDGGSDLLERDRGLRLEPDVLRAPGLGPARPVRRPVLTQVEPIGDREAGVRGGDREGDGDLAILLFAQLATVLPRDADRVAALLGGAGVIHEPTRDRPLARHGRQDGRAHRLVAPGGVGDQVMQGLVRGLHPVRRQPGGHRLDALALARQQQPGAVGVERRPAVGVAERGGQGVEVGLEPLRGAPGKTRGRRCPALHGHIL